MVLWIAEGPRGEKWSVLKRAWVQGTTIRKLNKGTGTYMEDWPPKDTWTELEMLVMERNDLDCSYLSSINQMANITLLDLGFIATFPKEIFELEKLEYLSIRGALMSTLPMEIGNLSRLKHLHLRQFCNRGVIPRGLISRLKNLQVLDLFCDRTDYPFRPKSAVGVYNLLGELVSAGVAENLKILGICLDAAHDNRAFLKQLMQKLVRVWSL
ncbi:hypothetical protein E2562_016090 [Oryza meyeriana var. granulata]|uniref:Disease resistance R13L4/SHOC-2-like LRR domain-containing protein n=1 Tax=Oryza meyeriana var. granulata TaxID=110450 RepID=A0A6G1BLJ1_9ORYZ|nr:hypothetical protein E2562_016090 [Oryza meyeriana var. granulata]